MFGERKEWVLGGSNRTFMELKYWFTPTLKRAFEGSNRTFMELKSPTHQSVSRGANVLIAPLWN